MSLKPLKASDQKKLNSLTDKRQKKIETMHELPPYIYIVSEGIKTEPYYISGLADAINQKYSRYTSDKRILIEGTGRNTKSLPEYGQKAGRRETSASCRRMADV